MRRVRGAVNESKAHFKFSIITCMVVNENVQDKLSVKLLLLTASVNV